MLGECIVHGFVGLGVLSEEDAEVRMGRERARKVVLDEGIRMFAVRRSEDCGVNGRCLRVEDAGGEARVWRYLKIPVHLEARTNRIAD